ncbi:MAG TPA: hypothetical protein PK640_01235 [Verrucomicrobiota bacterium]|nr:hypothetical protein [Verrucomicrobiota bacterium]
MRYESRTVFVELVFDGDRSFELGLLVGKGDAWFSIDEILRFRGAPDAASFSLIQITTTLAMARWVQKLADALRTYGSDLIAGNSTSFADLADCRRKEARTYALRENLRAARANADAAWRRKDYATVVKALKPLRAALTAAEVGKLEYAESRCRK